MIKRSAWLLTVIFCACVSAMAGALDEERADFEAAVDAYANGDFPSAYSGFSNLAERFISPELCVNIGSAAYRNGDDGEAALWFRRAVELDSQCSEARQNLRFLKRRLGFLSFDGGPFGEYGRVLRVPVWRFWFAVFSGVAAISLVAALMLRISRPLRNRLFTCCGIALILACILATGWWAATRDRPVLSLFVVVAPDTTALAAPNNSAGRIVAVPPGTEVAFLEQRGAWIYAEIPGSSRGWVRASQLTQLWPFSIRLLE
ncbi:MAG: hypothetical protein ACI9R3_000140 [Verrucomicrobiales bacterium]|jgi:hypothetical protein